MGIIFVNALLTFMLFVTGYLGAATAKMMYQLKDYKIMVFYLLGLTMLLSVAILVNIGVWVDSIRLLELRGIL